MGAFCKAEVALFIPLSPFSLLAEPREVKRAVSSKLASKKPFHW